MHREISPEVDEQPVAIAEARVVRLHLRSPNVSQAAVEDFCLQIGGSGDGWAGVGWGLWNGRSRISWPEYERGMSEKGEPVNQSVGRLHGLRVGALVWTRRREGSSYWLGEVTGPWEYRGDQTAEQLEMFNLRRCRWALVGTEDSVPGKIVSSFRPPMTLQNVKEGLAVRYTRQLHAQLTGRTDEFPGADLGEVIAELLGSRDLEDLIAVYLQDQHNLILVNRGLSTPGYEYVLRDRESGRRAVASVKSGGDPVNLDLLPTESDVDCYAFAVSGRYAGQRPGGFVEITTDALVEFITKRQAILPDQVRRWAALGR